MPMTTVGNFFLDQYLNDPSTRDALGNDRSLLLYDPGTEDPFTDRAVRERIFNALQSTPQGLATMQALQSPESTWQSGGTAYDSSLNIPDAPDRDDGDFGDIAKFIAIAGGLSGVGNMLAGGLGSAGAAGAGLADIGAYGGFGDLAAMGGAEAFGSGAGAAGLADVGAYGGFGDLASMGGAGAAGLADVGAGAAGLADVGGFDAITAADVQLGADILKNSGQTYEQFLNRLGGDAITATAIFSQVAKRVADEFKKDPLRFLTAAGGALAGSRSKRTGVQPRGLQSLAGLRGVASGGSQLTRTGAVGTKGRGGVQYFERKARGGAIKDGLGYLKSAHDGMADQINATIDNKRPAKLSGGEFVVPADVVSHLGNGNSEAGAKQLYALMERVREARTGSPKQGKQINPKKYLPQ